jgi:ubiquinone/menaquinone biosynthesis C-methylase UbiE
LVHPPERLVDELDLSVTSCVLEIGPGSGFFSATLAKRIPAGTLVLLDLRAEFVGRVRRRLSKLGLCNFTCTVGDACSLPFRDDSFEAAILVTVLGETADPGACIGEAHRVLKPGGILSVTELWLDPHFVSAPELRALISSTGFEHVDIRGPSRSYTARFRKLSPRG